MLCSIVCELLIHSYYLDGPDTQTFVRDGDRKVSSMNFKLSVYVGRQQMKHIQHDLILYTLCIQLDQIPWSMVGLGVLAGPNTKH